MSNIALVLFVLFLTLGCAPSDEVLCDRAERITDKYQRCADLPSCKLDPTDVQQWTYYEREEERYCYE